MILLTKRLLTYSIVIVFALFVSCKKSKNDTPPNNNPGDTSKPVPTGTWIYAGNIIDANNVNAQAALSVDKYGTAYILYQDGYNGLKATAMKLVDSTWTIIGKAGFSDATADRLSLAIDDASGAL